MDLLEHEVRIARLLCHIDVPVDVSDLRLNRGARLVGKGDSLRSELRELAILENDDVASRIDEGNHVRSHVRAGLATADNDGRILAGDGNHARLVGTDSGKAVGTHDMRAGLSDGGHEIVGLRIALLNEVGEYLGVRLGLEDMSTGDELFAELRKVLDDAVVDDRDAAVAARVGVGIGDRGLAVGRPTRVADATSRLLVHVVKLGLETSDLAHATDHIKADLGAVAHLKRHARRIIAAVLETLQAINENVLYGFRAGIAYDSTHIALPPLCRAPIWRDKAHHRRPRNVVTNLRGNSLAADFSSGGCVREKIALIFRGVG